MPHGDDCSRTLALLLLCGLPSLGQQTLPVWADSFSWEEGCGQVKSAGENDYSFVLRSRATTPAYNIRVAVTFYPPETNSAIDTSFVSWEGPLLPGTTK